MVCQTPEFVKETADQAGHRDEQIRYIRLTILNPKSLPGYLDSCKVCWGWLRPDGGLLMASDEGINRASQGRTTTWTSEAG